MPVSTKQQSEAALSYAKLHELYGYVSELDVFYPGEVSGKVAVASFLKKRGLVFWDLFGGDRKKENFEPEN